MGATRLRACKMSTCEGHGRGETTRYIRAGVWMRAGAASCAKVAHDIPDIRGTRSRMGVGVRAGHLTKREDRRAGVRHATSKQEHGYRRRGQDIMGHQDIRGHQDIMGHQDINIEQHVESHIPTQKRHRQ
ncbi:hypothetical protein GWK47_019406 [Chionoecetes opilio]|uniref:Uncharacterized protein n=1 Tax=Chionoecetes opilio TaxID=41210 RepID=A0A8J5CFV4_CHIOP|nr:hypothetical protein GWK47_019405 [Chionoecetes opilio]KAG0711991.1 hypothetical protein GWK47_019406 [Chionoecetes opilio]